MGTNTTNLGFYKPAIGETGWGTLVDDNFDTLDAFGAHEAIRYVDAPVLYGGIGANTNDGKSHASPFADIVTAYDALPSAGGTIVVHSVNGGQPLWDFTNPSRGLWILGPNDPNYASPPTGWRVEKGSLRIVGLGNGGAATSVGNPSVTTLIWGGSKSNPESGGLWISGTNHPIEIHNIASQDLASPVRLGLSSADGTTNINTAIILFDHCHFPSNQDNGYLGGPAVDIGYAFWVWFRHCSMTANVSQDLISSVAVVSGTTYRFTTPTHGLSVGDKVIVSGCTPSGYNGMWTITAKTATTWDANIGSNPAALSVAGHAKPLMSDRRSAVRMSATGAESNPGVITLEHTQFSGGGIRYRPAGNSSYGNIVCTNILMEGDFVSEEPPLFHVVADASVRYTGTAGYSMTLTNCTTADGVWTNGAIRTVDAFKYDDSPVVAIGCDNVIGPATLLNTYANLGTGQRGWVRSDRVLHGPHNGHKRSFHPAVTRYVNQAAQDVSTWSGLNGTASVTTGQTAPDGTTQAAKLTSASGQDYRRVATPSMTVAVGDWIVYGAWVKGDYTGLDTPLLFQFAETDFTFPVNANNYYVSPVIQRLTDGDWRFESFCAKVGAIGTNPVLGILDLTVTNGYPITYYAPVLIRIPAGDMTDAEAWEFTDGLATYSDTATAGQVSLLRSQSLHIPQGYVEGFEISAPSAPVANGYRIYSEDNGAGKTRLMVKFNTGAAQQIAIQP